MNASAVCEPAAEGEKDAMNQPHALVVDDNPQNLRVLTQMLSKQGVVCAEYASPTQLSEHLPEMGPVDLVFLDLEMPGYDGYVVKEMLREHLGNVPIIAYTVHVSEINVVRRLGFNGFLSKPLSSERFPAQLARILRGEPVWDRV
ncbi:MAG: response regulator [Chloroflexi bacterium]|nr:response regulator [Chloroflexota bacterium]